MGSRAFQPGSMELVHKLLIEHVPVQDPAVLFRTIPLPAHQILRPLLRLKSQTIEPCTPSALDLHRSEPRDMKVRVNMKM